MQFFRTSVLLLLPAILLAQDPDDKTQHELTASAQAGKKEFQQTCAFCHGPDARGASAPDLIRSSLLSHDVQGDLIGSVIRNGRPAKGMPSFQLSDPQIRAIADFLHEEASIAASVSQKIPSDYPLQKLLVGNASDGKAYFDARCASCHSTTGDLAHLASKYKPFDLQTRIAFPSGVKPSITVKDNRGELFEGELIYADEFLVSLRDKDGWRHTWKRSTVKADIHDPLAGHEKLLKTYTDKNVHDLFAYLETLK
ncbi:MAG: c-type cytochrome [Acidobacteriaceae bacterium]|nr:c-type cytochrome [Acidobacteriaceae bacterium]